jgi:predicted phosphodiesterase
MRVFAVSDVHIDYQVNADWIRSLSRLDYRDDLLILAGDVSHRLPELAWCFGELVARFKHVLFVPGNHELWVLGEDSCRTSLDKFADVVNVAQSSGASMQPFLQDGLLIVPLLGWYDYSFGEPSEDLLNMWTDYAACRWPPGYRPADVAAHFTAMNRLPARQAVRRLITFSHFMPRIDLIPAAVPSRHRVLDPVLGSVLLERQLRELEANIHVYGHSHINRCVQLDGVTYVNNALGYPNETRIAVRQLLRIDEL